MRNNLSTICLTLMGISGVIPSAYGEQGDVVFTYDYAGATQDMFGVQRCVQIDAAMLLQDPSFVGFEISGVSIDIPTKEGCSCSPEASAWLTKELKVDGEFNSPDLQEVSGTIRNYGTEESPELRLDITFPEPYVMTEDGVYVGYSVTVTNCNVPGSGWTAKYPIVTVCDIDKPGSFMIHCTKGSSTLPQKYPEWIDMNESKHQALAMKVIMKGEISADAAGLAPQHTLYVAPGTTGNVYTDLNNYGTVPISSVEYSYTIEGNGVAKRTVTQGLQLETPVVGQVGAYTTLDLPFEAPDVVGNYKVDLRINKVNGMENGFKGSSILNMEVVPFLPDHCPLVEEYSGLWCGNCPEVYVTIKQMQDKYGKDFLPISYHVDDTLQSLGVGEMPREDYGLPDVYIEDRKKGLKYNNIGKTWLTARRTLAPADIKVKLFWEDKSHKALRAESIVKFVYDDPDANYMLTYAMVEDDMSDPKWAQRNFFTDYDYEGPYWDLFCHQPFVVTGLIFDDIIVNFPATRGIAESLPGTIEGLKDYRHSYVLDLKDATCKFVTADNNGQSLIQNPNKLRIVVLIIDGDTGNVVNSASTVYSADAEEYGNTGMADVDTEEFTDVEYYSLDGNKLNGIPESGIIIVLKRTADGRFHTEKVVL